MKNLQKRWGAFIYKDEKCQVDYNVGQNPTGFNFA